MKRPLRSARQPYVSRKKRESILGDNSMGIALAHYVPRILKGQLSFMWGRWRRGRSRKDANG